MDWTSLLKGEIELTISIAAGFMLGTLILRTGLADKLMKHLMPYLRKAGIGSVLGMALTVSLGSAKAGAALIATAYDDGRISERTAKWGTLMLSFPAYLHRWPSTMVMAASMAGLSGAIFAAVILMRTALRFVGRAALRAKARQKKQAASATGPRPTWPGRQLRTCPSGQRLLPGAL